MPVSAVPRESAGQADAGRTLDHQALGPDEAARAADPLALLLILGLCCWAAGIPLVIRDRLGPIIIATALILPDVAGFGIAWTSSRHKTS